ncbi:uncharacterized protein EV420DRAFT_854583 [Desarmillaria tabescens]|uniref:Zn(2)-C6 fungal-type domain-containing protein n=1 Tax=Armillaria tabescens TaxID=1929756 RepID=A0AA39MV88_ARMTA|nr:uncharacterized protein EV420DRAFT_854583 [Desarmillaria tabescens]KAK0448336.1 hypothetical protein EV420DRAFT_854583 [Desarmillaria tabescens]
MPPIRPHNKTRSGCKTCKKRKVKCDEELPMCKNCTRRGAECVWINAPQLEHNSALPGTSAQAGSSSHESPPSTISRCIGESSFDMLNLELLHHYSTATSYSLSSDPATANVWRIVVPKIAFDPRNKCLLHAILAVSALHARYADPTATHYAIAASTHHWQAKTGVQKAEMDGKVDINAVFITEALVALYEFATSTTVSSYSSGWQITFRAIPPKVARNWTQLQNGVLRPMFITLAPTIILTSPEGPFLSSLSTLLSTENSPPDVEELHDVSVYKSYKDSIHFLEISWKASFEKDYCMHASCMWWSKVSNTFIRLLIEQRPRALIILAHYCVMMKRVAEDGPWWVRKQWGNEATRIMSVLDARWTPWIGWLSNELDPPCENQAFDFTGTDFINWLNEAGTSGQDGIIRCLE